MTQRRIRRWLAYLVPILALALLLSGPLIIWVLKDEEPVLRKLRVRGEVVAGEVAGLDRERRAARLADGRMVELRGDAPAPGTQVTVIETIGEDGSASFEVERN